MLTPTFIIESINSVFSRLIFRNVEREACFLLFNKVDVINNIRTNFEGEIITVYRINEDKSLTQTHKYKTENIEDVQQFVETVGENVYTVQRRIAQELWFHAIVYYIGAPTKAALSKFGISWSWLNSKVKSAKYMEINNDDSRAWVFSMVWWSAYAFKSYIRWCRGCGYPYSFIHI